MVLGFEVKTGWELRMGLYMMLENLWKSFHGEIYSLHFYDIPTWDPRDIVAPLFFSKEGIWDFLDSKIHKNLKKADQSLPKVIKSKELQIFSTVRNLCDGSDSLGIINYSFEKRMSWTDQCSALRIICLFQVVLNYYLTEITVTVVLLHSFWSSGITLIKSLKGEILESFQSRKGKNIYLVMFNLT